ncbi:MAG: hypothetical protein ACYC0V_20715, partial [Armatimonadota bacterium]
MKQTNRFVNDMLDYDLPEAAGDVLWRACRPTGARISGDVVALEVPFQAQKRGGALTSIVADDECLRVNRELVVRAYGDAVIRVTLAVDGEIPGDESVMLEWHESL